MYKRIITVILFIVSGFFISTGFSCKKSVAHYSTVQDTDFKAYLALGDSYTIGQSVDASESFPFQLSQELKKAGIHINAPEIRAVTGWTTGNLISSLRTTPPHLSKYSLVTLLIGVNNQYQQRTLTEYKIEFNYLLNEAIRYAGDKKNVLVVSIPDYSVTPFAASGNTAQIADEINQFNAAQKTITLDAGVKFIDITPISRQGETDPEMQAPDGLHPSAKQYKMWVDLMLPQAKEIVL